MIVLVSVLSHSSLPQNITIPELLEFLCQEKVAIHKELNADNLFSTDKNIQRFVLSLAEHYKPTTVVGQRKSSNSSTQQRRRSSAECENCRKKDQNNNDLYKNLESHNNQLEQELAAAQQELATIKQTVALLPTIFHNEQSNSASFSQQLHAQAKLGNVTSTPGSPRQQPTSQLAQLQMQWQTILSLRDRHQNGSTGSVTSVNDASEVFDSAIDNFDQNFQSMLNVSHQLPTSDVSIFPLPPPQKPNFSNKFQASSLPRASTTSNFTQQPYANSNCSSNHSSYLNSSQRHSPIGFSSQITPSASAGTLRAQQHRSARMDTIFKRSGSFDNRTKVVYYVNDDEYVTCIFKLPEDVLLSDFKRVFKPIGRFKFFFKTIDNGSTVKQQVIDDDEPVPIFDTITSRGIFCYAKKA